MTDSVFYSTKCIIWEKRVAEAAKFFERQREKFSEIKGNDLTEGKYNEHVYYLLYSGKQFQPKMVIFKPMT